MAIADSWPESLGCAVSAFIATANGRDVSIKDAGKPQGTTQVWAFTTR
jgi:hypothetical protein